MARPDDRLMADDPYPDPVTGVEPAFAHTTALNVSGASELRPKVIDVRGLPCSTRRAQVYAAAAELQPGESFVFINDHDPRHLHLLLCDTFGVAWSWNYEEAGPERYAVRVGRPDRE
ncbi:MAG: DUF2249 domain-containing protein [Chloroflexaceae bacterium]